MGLQFSSIHGTKCLELYLVGVLSMDFAACAWMDRD